MGDVENMLPPVVDLERTPKAGDEAEYLRDVQAFLSMIEDNTGCTQMIYASPSFYTQYLGTGLGQYPLWLAEYSHTAKPPQGRDWYFWQHQQNGTVDGISGSVDLDWFAGDADALASLQC